MSDDLTALIALLVGYLFGAVLQGIFFWPWGEP